MPSVPAQSFPMQAKRAWHVVATGIGVVAAGVGLLQRGTWPTGGWVTIACGAVLALWFGQPAWRRAPMIWFDDDGLRARIPGFGPLPWNDIESVRFVRARGRSFLVVDRIAALRRGSRSMVAQSLARAAEASDLAVPLDGLAATPDKVFAIVDLAHRHALGRS